jgi:PAS domain S-box-containing protein
VRDRHDRAGRHQRSAALAGAAVIALVAVVDRARKRVERAVAVSEEVLERERLARRRSEFLARASRLLEAPPDPAEMLERIAELAVPDLAELCIVDLVEDGELRRAAAKARDPEVAAALCAARRRFPLDAAGDHPVATVARTGEARLLPAMGDADLARFAAAPEHLELMRRLRYSSAIVVPLVARGRMLGALSCLRFAGDAPYVQDDLEVVAEIARRAALALDNARLFQELERAERRLEAILDDLGEAVAVQDRDGLVYANRAAAELFGAATADEVLATPVEELQQRFVLLDEHGDPLAPDRYPGARALAGDHPEPLLVRNIVRATGEERWLLAKATPLADEHGEVVMAVNVLEDVTPVQRAERQQRFLSAASKLVSSSLDVEATLDKVAWAVVPELADWCRVDIPSERGVPQQGALAHVDARGRELLVELRTRHPQTQESAIAQVMKTGEPLFFPTVDEATMRRYSEDEEEYRLLREIGTRSAVIVPMTAGDRSIGVITIATSVSARRLGEDELALLVELGRRAGIAVENARVHAARSHIATTLQRSLLPPRLPVLPGMTIAARFRAAGEASEVGGDFYDLFPAGEAWMVVMGDVTGKGPEAAAITSLARYTMRTAAMYERSPGAVLDRLNRALAGDADRRRLCTAICARIRTTPGGAEVTVARGGHPPPFHLRRGRARALGGGGPLLGAFPGGHWKEDRVVLASGESLVLYTDGVTDARGETGRFGQERLAALLARVTDADADEIASSVDEALQAFQFGPQRDDVALLVLRASPEDGLRLA